MNIGVFDESFSEAFLSRLHTLNSIGAKSGVPIASNLCYAIAGNADLGLRPDPSLAPARRNFCRVAKFKRSMLEIGFGAGHSALLALSSNPGLSYFGIELAGTACTINCADFLSGEFEGRFQILIADSREALPYLAISDRLKFDFIHLDGGASADLLRADLSNALRLLRPEGHLIINNINSDDREAVFFEYVMAGLVSSETLGNLWEDTGNVLLRSAAAGRY